MRRRGWAAAFVVMLVAGLASGVAARPGNDPRIIRAVRAHYNGHALEDGCTAPILVLFRDLMVMESYELSRTLRMRARLDYEQRDPATGQAVCAGSSVRYFTVMLSERGPVVTHMTGADRD